MTNGVVDSGTTVRADLLLRLWESIRRGVRTEACVSLEDGYAPSDRRS